MFGMRCAFISWVLLVTAIPAAAAAATVDWSGCAVPVFGTDKHATVTACTAILDRADLSDADRERARITRGRASHMRGDIDAAAGDFDAAIKLEPKDPEPLTRRASVAFFKRDYQRAKALAEQAVALDDKYAFAYDTLGVIAVYMGDMVTAKRSYDRALALDPGLVATRFHRSQFLAQIGANAESIDELDRLLALNSPDVDVEFTDIAGRDISYRLVARLNRATTLEDMGRFPEALKAFDDFVKTDPGVFSYGWRGRYYFNRSEFELAKADLDKALAYDQNYWILHDLQGQVALYQHHYEDAIAEFSRSLAQHPTYSGSSYWSRALALRALNRTDDAQKDALAAVTEDCCFFLRKLNTLTKLGYLQPIANKADLVPAVRDAVQACMLDEKCW